MTDVYIVQHCRDLDDGSEDVKFIGVYSSTEDAEDAVDRLRQKPGFFAYPDGFSIDRYEIGRDHWSEGFS
jgi:hypothetical protein